MNHVILIGRLTKDIDLQSTRNGKHVAQFNIGVRRDKDTSDFPTCVAWGKTAELLQKYCQKGSLIGVEGSIQTSNYQKDGRTVYKTVIAVSSVEFLSSKTNNSTNQETAQNELEISDSDFQDIDDEALPF